MSDPAGGMGYHYGNPAFINGSVAVTEPEVLLYEPQKNGSLRLVGVEYVVPFGAWTAPHPPELFGQHFHRNEAFGLWALHVWVWRHKPERPVRRLEPPRFLHEGKVSHAPVSHRA